MKSQRILRESSIIALKQRVASDPNALELYVSAASFPEIEDGDLLNTAISSPDSSPTLVVSSGNVKDVAATDYENAVLVYSYLRGLNRTQAADARLWVTLAHTTFWDYVRARWGEDDRSKLRTAVFRHWFVPEGGGKAALRTQAISRLWWAAHLTYAPWETDPELSVFKTSDKFHFTGVLLRRQQIYFDLVERDFGSDLRLRICVLDSLNRYLSSVTWKDGLSRESSKRLNLLAKHRQIASLPIDQLRKACDDLIAATATQLGDHGSSPEP
jgi:hypothetical protein